MAGVFALATSIATALGQTSYPMVTGVSPLAARIGDMTECEVSAQHNLAGAYRVFVSGTGVTGEVVPPEVKEVTPPATPPPAIPKIKVRFIVAADASPGVRSFRLATPRGASTVGNLVLTREPVLRESAENNSLATAQAVTLPAAICGAIESAEDVDLYKFTVAADACWTFHVRCQRCENQIHDLQTHCDPILSLKDAQGATLAFNDNFLHGDPLLFHSFAAAGEYFLEIRDVRYQGNADWQYLVEATDAPFVVNVSPLGVTPGAQVRLSLSGFNLPADPAALLVPAAETSDGEQWFPLVCEGRATYPAPVIVHHRPAMFELEGENSTPAAAQAIAAPVALCGRVEKAGDVDCFALETRQGEAFTFEVHARRRQSSLDSILRILDANGAPLVENDDMSVGRLNCSDSLIENWTAPSTGKIVLEVTDCHERGGQDFPYMLEVTRSEPYFTLDLDTDKTHLGPGTASPIFVRAYRKNGFAGEIALSIEGLPENVTAQCGRILATGNDGAILLQAAPNAAVSASNVRIVGSATHKMADGRELKLSAVATPLQEIYMPGGGRSHYPVEMHTVAVCEPLDIKSVKLSATEVKLKPGESQRIDVTIERREGFEGNATLDVVYQHLGSIFGASLPKGVSIDEKNSKTLLSGKETQGHITLVAAADAPAAERQQAPIMAHVSINFVMKMTYAGEPFWVTVAP